ncbi:MAG: AMP-binding protein [Bauldia sp.]|nr:AMP-binding protein [Bauldia sp.]MCW5719122.1 AMP-binding protein [Bauldia sp.]
MSSPITLSPDLVWASGRPHPIDFGGPVGVPFEPFGEWGERHALERVDEMVRRHHDKIAVDDGVTRITYAELKRQIDDLAARIDVEAPLDRPVAAIVHTTAGFVPIILAAVATGRTLVTIDAGYPVERQTMVFTAAQPGAVLLAADRRADDSFVPPGIPRIVYDPATAGSRTRPPLRKHTGPISVMFTSGSTGKAKGLASSTDGGLASLGPWVEAAHLNENDVILAVGSPAIGGGGDAVMAVLLGATVRILDLRATGLVEAFRQLAQERVTVLSFVPTALRNIFRVPGAKEAFHALRVLMLFGESTLASDIALFRANLPKDCVISITLASTEAGGVFQWFVRDEAITGPVIPVGYVSPFREVALVGEDGGNVALGEVGQIVVRARTMASGGWEDGHLTPPPSFEDPTKPGYRIYATGDYARLREDGLYEFAGRLDQQVKIRGLKADLGVVEAGLRGFPGVLDAVTLLLSPETKLVAFVTLQPGVPGEAMPLAIRGGLAKTMPDHMVPAQVMVLEAIPRLPNHKPDRMRLMALARGGA